MFGWLQDAVFPLTCVGCGREKTIACTDCLAGVQFFSGDCCVSGLQQVIALYPYADPVVKGVLREAKFHAVQPTEEAILRLVDKGLAKHGGRLPRGADVVVVPVPTYIRRVRERGFDQVHWIAADISAYLDAMLVEALQARPHERQSHIPSEDERAVNIAGVFRISGDVKGKRVILVDDVVTSGATMQEAARVLKEAGAKEIWGVALARGGKKEITLQK